MANEIDEKGVKNDEGNQPEAPAGKNAAGGSGESDPEKKLTAVEEHDALMRANEALAKDKQKILDDIAALRVERRDARATVAPAPAEQKPEVITPAVEEPPADYEGWKKQIDKQSENAAKKVVSSELNQIKDSQKKKAYKKFIESHPEYSPSSDPEDKKFQSLLGTYNRIKSRTDMDADDILEDLEDSYAVQHRSEILERDRQARRSNLEQEISTADIAASSPSSGERDRGESVVLTQSEMKIYREVLKNIPGMTPTAFKKRLKEQDE